MSSSFRTRVAPRAGRLALVLVGVDYRTAPIEMRERLSFGGDEVEAFLESLRLRPEIEEAFLLSTCNRTELYLGSTNPERARDIAFEALFLDRAPELAEPERHFDLRDTEAARHLLSVAAGLESMVLGEPEILGQVKRAADRATQSQTTGVLLRRLLRTAVQVGKRARSETSIGTGAVSLGYAVVELSKNIFRTGARHRVLIVGAGETARIVARNLLEKDEADLTVTNRSPERAVDFQRELPAAEIIPYENLADGLVAADVVVASTAATEPVVTREQIVRAMRLRSHRPLLAVDLGVPRNVEVKAGRVANVFLHDIDSLEHLIDRNLGRRREEVPAVTRIVENELDRFDQWQRGLEADPVVTALQRRAEAIRKQEVERAIAGFPPETHEALEVLTRSLVRKVLHHPTIRMREPSHRRLLGHLDVVRELFALEGEDE